MSKIADIAMTIALVVIVFALAMLLTGCSSTFKRDGSDLLVVCLFPCIVWQREGTVDTETKMPPGGPKR